MRVGEFFNTTNTLAAALTLGTVIFSPWAMATAGSKVAFECLL